MPARPGRSSSMFVPGFRRTSASGASGSQRCSIPSRERSGASNCATRTLDKIITRYRRCNFKRSATLCMPHNDGDTSFRGRPVAGSAQGRLPNDHGFDECYGIPEAKSPSRFLRACSSQRIA